MGPYFGMQNYQHPAGQYQHQPPQMNMKRGQYQIPPQYPTGFATQQAGYPYPHAQAGQSSAGSFDYSGYDAAAFGGQADNSNDNADSADKAEHQMPPNQAQMYNQFAPQQHANYQAQMYYHQQMQQQPTAQYNMQAYHHQQWQQQP